MVGSHKDCRQKIRLIMAAHPTKTQKSPTFLKSRGFDSRPGELLLFICGEI